MTTSETVLRADQARLSITYNGQEAELPDPINVGMNDAEVKAVVSEVLRSGGLEALGQHADADRRLANYMVDRYAPTEKRPHWLFMIRPKTPFGGDKAAKEAKEAKKAAKKHGRSAKKAAKQAKQAAAAEATAATPAAVKTCEWNKQEKKRFERKMNKIIARLDKLAERHEAPELAHITSRLVYIRNVPHEYLKSAGRAVADSRPAAAPPTPNTSGAHSPAGRPVVRA